MVLQEMHRVLVDMCDIQPGTRLLVGVSGGPDSLSLLDGLVRLGYMSVAAHYNHGLRPEADEDARHVQRMAEQMGVNFTSAASDVREFARETGMSLEEAARTVRYRFLFSEAHRLGCAAVAVGHTADDQVETVLMHFLRGAGLSGLRGMLSCAVMPEWDDAIPLVRPLLGVWREDVVAYCQEHALEPVFDKSNLDTTFFRNRLRHELIPTLQDYNPQVKEVLWRMSQTAAGDYDLLHRLTLTAWNDCRIEEGPDFVVMSLIALHKMERGLKRNVMRLAIGKLRPGLRDIDFQSIERAASFIETPSQTHSLDLIAGLILYVSGDRLFLGDRSSSLLLSEWPQMPTGDEFELAVPGRLELHAGWVLESHWIEKVDRSIFEQRETDPFQVRLDAACISLPLRVRTRRPGDRFRPLGMDGHSLKLSDFWINEHLPRPARPGWPLVCSKDEIVWIPGYRPAETCRLQQETRRAVHLILKQRSS
jgi:tRNA(Ile)-lysidine synthase